MEVAPAMKLEIHADHHQVHVYIGGFRFDIPEPIGKETEKNPERRAKAAAFNADLGKAWVRRILSGKTHYAVPLSARMQYVRIKQKKNKK
jgi:hypothetical protein